MTRSRTARRIVTLAASFTLLATAPAAVAFAHDSDSGSNCSTSRGNSHDDSLDCLTAAQATAVKAARADYKAAAKAILSDLKTALKPAKEKFTSQIAGERAAKDAARDAYMNALKTNADPTTQADLKAKYEAARNAYIEAAKKAYAKYQAEVTEASASAKVDLAKAVVVYTKAINNAFAPEAPPAGLLKSPGGGFDYNSYGPTWFGFHHGWGGGDSGHDDGRR